VVTHASEADEQVVAVTVVPLASHGGSAVTNGGAVTVCARGLVLVMLDPGNRK